MLIALEGPDGAGKTSLARALQEARPGLEYRHFSQPKTGPIDEYVYSIGDYSPSQDGGLVLDRWFVGEDVYGPLYRDESSLSTAHRRWITMWGRSRGATLVHVTHDLHVLQSRMGERGEDFLRPQDVETVVDAFDEYTSASPLFAQTVRLDGDVSTIVDEVLQEAERRAALVSELSPFTSYVGAPLPRALLVGEKRGGEPPYATTSAFSPARVNSGTYLLEALDEDLWPVVGLVNGVEEGPERLRELVDVLAGPPVVALGRAASDALFEAGIEHGGVPHPQFVKRFNHARQLEYGALISDSIRTGKVAFSWPS